MGATDPRLLTFHELTAADFDTVTALARSIWAAHYVPLIGAEQVEYMLRRRFTADKLRSYLGMPDRALEIVRARAEADASAGAGVDGGPHTGGDAGNGGDARAGRAIGYLSYAHGDDADELTLEQLYLSQDRRGFGLGAAMLQHVEERALSLGRHTLVLQVNKRNQGSIGFYAKAGFTVRAAAVFDIGGGFVMDDYIMAKRL